METWFITGASPVAAASGPKPRWHVAIRSPPGNLGGVGCCIEGGARRIEASARSTTPIGWGLFGLGAVPIRTAFLENGSRVLRELFEDDDVRIRPSAWRRSFGQYPPRLSTKIKESGPCSSESLRCLPV